MYNCDIIQINSNYSITLLFCTSLRNVRQYYVTINVTLVAKCNIYHLCIYYVSKYGGDGRTSSKLHI